MDPHICPPTWAGPGSEMADTAPAGTSRGLGPSSALWWQTLEPRKGTRSEGSVPSPRLPQARPLAVQSHAVLAFGPHISAEMGASPGRLARSGLQEPEPPAPTSGLPLQLSPTAPSASPARRTINAGNHGQTLPRPRGRARTRADEDVERQASRSAVGTSDVQPPRETICGFPMTMQEPPPDPAPHARVSAPEEDASTEAETQRPPGSRRQLTRE